MNQIIYIQYSNILIYNKLDYKIIDLNQGYNQENEL